MKSKVGAASNKIYKQEGTTVAITTESPMTVALSTIIILICFLQPVPQCFSFFVARFMAKSLLNASFSGAQQLPAPQMAN